MFFVHDAGDTLLGDDPALCGVLQCFRHLLQGVLRLAFLEFDLPDFPEASLAQHSVVGEHVPVEADSRGRGRLDPVYEEDAGVVGAQLDLLAAQGVLLTESLCGRLVNRILVARQPGGYSCRDG